MAIVGVYKIVAPSGEVFIGSSIDIETRWSYYKRLWAKSKSRLYHSFKTHGVENHIFEIVEECTVEELRNREYEVYREYKNSGCRMLNVVIPPITNI